MSEKMHAQQRSQREPAHPAKSGAHGDHHGGHDHGEGHAAHDHDDELIVVPKGNSALRFVLTFLIIIVILALFTVTGPMMATFSGEGRRGADAYLFWRDAAGKQHELSELEFLQAKQGYARLMEGIAGRRDVSDEDAATFLVESRLAAEQGVEITDRDLARFLRERLRITDTNAYEQYVRRLGLTIKEFEDLLRQQLRVERRRLLLASAMSVARDPDAIEQQWQDRFREYRFEYVHVGPEDMSEAARAALPADEELAAWYEGLTPTEKNTFLSEPRQEADFAYFVIGGDLPETLLSKYPRPEGDDPEELARSYYDLVHPFRFRRPAPEEGTEEPAEPYFSFDDVADACRLEAPVYFALDAWRASLASQVRSNPEIPLDLAAETTGVGLNYTDDQIARTASEWSSVATIGSDRLGQLLQRTPEGNLTSSIVASADALVVGRVLRAVAPEVPPYETVKERVAEEWIERHSSKLALERLEAFYAQLKGDKTVGAGVGGLDVSEEEFRAAADEAGLTVEVREWRDRVNPPEGGFAEAAPIEKYLQMQTGAFIIADGQVLPPSEDRRSGEIFLVRLAGSRDPELVAKKPKDFVQLEGMVNTRRLTSFNQSAFGFERLAETHDLHFALRPETTAPADGQ